MGIILGILLVVLGLLAAENFIVSKIPAAKDLIAKLRVYEEAIGITGMVIGFLSFLEWLSWLPHLNLFLLRGLIALASVLVAFALGLIFGLEALRRNLKDPTPAVIIHLDGIRFKLVPYKELLGLAGLVLGIISILWVL
jgi:hypothetical protein